MTDRKTICGVQMILVKDKWVRATSLHKAENARHAYLEKEKETEPVAATQSDLLDLGLGLMLATGCVTLYAIFCCLDGGGNPWRLTRIRASKWWY